MYGNPERAIFYKHLHLQPHPEGGWYRKTCRAAETIPADALPERFSGGGRHFSTAIYYLLEQEDFSAFHCIKSYECWHWYAGGTLHIHVIEPDGNYYRTALGNSIEKGEQLQVVVSALAWFSAEPALQSHFVLTGCIISLCFDFPILLWVIKEPRLKNFQNKKS